jgi:Pyruvate/2-oxoacid:ferredoxin oxidoreductase gamma subunit
MRLSHGSIIIINTDELYPPAVNLGEAPYPSDAIETVKQLFPKVKVVDATALALQAGNMRTVNKVLLGTLSAFLPVVITMWEKLLKERSFLSQVSCGPQRGFPSGKSGLRLNYHLDKFLAMSRLTKKT